MKTRTFLSEIHFLQTFVAVTPDSINISENGVGNE